MLDRVASRFETLYSPTALAADRQPPAGLARFLGYFLRQFRGAFTARLIAVARGDAPPDTVIEGARVFSAYTREWLGGDVAIAGGRIAGVGSYSGGERIDARGRFLVPGFIDAHVHLESAKLTPAQFARAVVPRGTTAVVCRHGFAAERRDCSDSACSTGNITGCENGAPRGRTLP